MINFSIEVASEKHIPYVAEILHTIEEAAKDRGTGIAKRNPEYVAQKMREGSIGNLCSAQIKAKMEAIMQSVSLNTIHQAIGKLLDCVVEMK